MRASLLAPMDEGQGVTREPLSVVAIHQDTIGLDRAKLFYRLMEQEFGDDFCFDCVFWSMPALIERAVGATQDAAEADLILLAMGQTVGFVDEISGWLRFIRQLRHSPFSLVCLTDDPLMGAGRIHASFRELAGRFSMVYLPETASQPQKTPSSESARLASPVTLSPVLFQQLVGIDPHHTGGIND